MRNAHQPASPPVYRAYRVGPDGRLTGMPTVLEAFDDEGAITLARKLVDGTGVEVWERARRVASLPPRDEPETSSVGRNGPVETGRP